MKRRVKLTISFAVLIAWVAAIFAFSSETYQQQTIVPYLKKHWTEEQITRHVPDWQIVYNGYRYSLDRDPYHFIEFVFRKCAHLFMYGTLGVIVFLLLRKWVRPLYGQAFLTVCIVAALASADEWNQTRSAGRIPTLNDIAVDVTGAICGMIVVLIVLLVGGRLPAAAPSKKKKRRRK